MTRVAVTGLGALTPVGKDVESSWRSLTAGRSGVGPITTFDASTYPVRIAGMVSDFEDGDLPNPSLARYLSRGGKFGFVAGAQALEDAGVADAPYEPHEKGIAMGSSVGRPELQELSDVLHTREASEGHELLRRSPLEIMTTSQNVGPGALAQMGDLRGPMMGISTACTASAHAVGEASRRIQEGEAKLMLAGGADALTTWLDVLGFTLLGALTKDYNDDPEHGSRPFDRDRTGFVLGEGAVMMVLEDMDAARKRGAKIYGEIAGYGSSLNAYRMTDPPPDGSGPDIAMKNALRESGLAIEDIDHVVAHGTGTPGGDVSETIAIKRVFGDHAKKLAVNSNKSMTGHTTCAAGALSLMTALLAMRDGVIAPTINLDNPDPELDLDYVPNQAREAKVDAAMINAFAFGGTNGCLVVAAPDAAQ
jgi:3-oxoacyl-[acyl-carrier-protein] synthase II